MGRRDARERKILIVEDEAKISRLLEIELESEGYQVTKADNGLDALEAYRSQEVDLILLDVMLPGMSGIELLRRIRAHDSHTAVLLLTAKSSVEDKVSGLDLGANDYITKPFQIEELLARIRAALRLQGKPHPEEETAGDWLTAADLKLNEGTREVIRDGRRIDLTPREFDLLVYLLKNKRQVLNREQILAAVWGTIITVIPTSLMYTYVTSAKNRSWRHARAHSHRSRRRLRAERDPMKLSSKIHLYSSVLMAAILIVMNLSVYYVFSKMTVDSQLEQAEAEAGSIVRSIAHSVATIPIDDLLRSYVPADGKIQFVPADSKAKSPYVTSSGEDMDELKLPYNANKQVEQIRYEGMRYVLVSLPVIWSDGAVYNIQFPAALPLRWRRCRCCGSCWWP